MAPNKVGQIVRFHTPYPEEDPNQLYVILEIYFDLEKPRAYVKALGLEFSFGLTSVYYVEDLEVVEIGTSELLGHKLTIKQPGDIQATGRVINVEEKKIFPDYNLTKTGVDTNVWLTILDNYGKTHSGFLYVM
ncbi:MAG TPA: hypothetical protein PKX60_05135 [Prolixibacteraceae bacterium]|nr:hypothetical protein [Prolixibacteraceae bacterium]